MMKVVWPRGFCLGFGKNPKFWQTRGESCRGEAVVCVRREGWVVGC